jgi:glycosyltransferase involved in cell wall biosynthesis
MIAARRTFARHFTEPYDAIDIHFALNALPLLPFIAHRTPRIVHFHGPWAAESRAEGGGLIDTAVKAALERFVYRSCDRFVVLSTAFKQVLTGYGVPSARIAVIPMGIDTSFFRPSPDRAAVRATLGWPADATVFFTARRLVARVGVLELVRASGANAVLKIAGKGPLRGEIERAIMAAGLGDCVELLGFVSEDALVCAYQAADVTILPTQALEGFGTIISESLACGTPVIVTPIGGMPEAVVPLGNMCVTRSPAPLDIAEQMIAVAKGTTALPDAEACRRYATATFDWSTVWLQNRAVFAGALTAT